jgi:hypothetical protein
MKLFRAIVLDTWQQEGARTREVAQALGLNVSKVQARLDRLEEAFIYDRAIDRETYVSQRDKLREELVLADLQLHDARIEGLDVEAVLGFAEYLVSNAGRVWAEATLEQKQRLQATIFPHGLPFDGRNFGTAATCFAFMQLRESSDDLRGVASPPGFEPGFQP